jgi:murein DD-endopeptidase MepM/ murein hydrolase activator NlpD
VTLVAVVGAVLGVFTLLNSGNQEAATLPLSESAQPATMAATTSPTSEALSPATEHTTVVTDMLETLPEPAPAPLWREETVRSGDNLSLIFARAGFNDSDVYRVTQAEGGKALRKIFPGETIGFLVNPDTGALEGVRHSPSRLLTTLFTLGPDGDFEREVITQEPEVRTRGVTMTIESSLFVAGQSAGLSGPVIMELANIFGGVIDFVLDPRQGDTIEVVYEEHFLEGEKLTDGNIIAASFTNRGETFAAFRYSDNDGHTSYYNEQGVSMRKAFLMAPVDFTRISSNFNPNRLHPIYKTKRPHRGTDYAAPTGTPVYAAGDGRVVEAGYNGANGNYVFIQHGEGFKTHYLHLHKRKVQKGQKVDQGDIIGTVGATGSATGPHLHYEFLVNGVHRNPRTVHKLLPKAKSLSEFELPRYKEAIAEPMAQLAALRQETRLALAEQ